MGAPETRSQEIDRLREENRSLRRAYADEASRAGKLEKSLSDIVHELRLCGIPEGVEIVPWLRNKLRGKNGPTRCEHCDHFEASHTGPQGKRSCMVLSCKCGKETL